MVTLLNLFRNCQIIFQGGYIILHSYQQCVKVPVSLPTISANICDCYFDCNHSGRCSMTYILSFTYLISLFHDHSFNCDHKVLNSLGKVFWGKGRTYVLWYSFTTTHLTIFSTSFLAIHEDSVISHYHYLQRYHVI